MKTGILFGAALWCFGGALFLDGTQAGISLFSGVLLFTMGVAEIE